METNELTRRLREIHIMGNNPPICGEAADEIERLQRDLAAAERALSTARGEVWREATEMAFSPHLHRCRSCGYIGTDHSCCAHESWDGVKLEDFGVALRARAEKEQGKC
jgi:hypothetical protein